MGRRERQKQKRNQLFITFLLVALMVLSVLGIFIGSPTSQGSVSFDLEYDGFDFEFGGNYYVVEVEENEKKFYFHPIDLLSIDRPDIAVLSLTESPVIVVTFDPEMVDIESAEVSRYQIGYNLGKIIYNAVTQESEVYPYPVVTCANATPTFPVLYLEQSNSSSITYDNGCVTVSGQGINLIQGVERLIYEMLGVMNE